MKQSILFIGLFVISFIAHSADAERACQYQASKKNAYQYNEVVHCAQHNVHFQNLLGVLHVAGEKTAKDMRKAYFWFNKAAHNGSVKAMFNLGNMLRNGSGVEKDFKQAFMWYEKAAKRGHLPSQHNLGYMYGEGQGVKRNSVLAYSWFYVGMKQGHQASFINANNLLGSLSKKGFEEGVRYGNELYALYAKKPETDKPL